MIEPSILAFQNAAVLEALADPAANGVSTIDALAKRFDRDPSNFRKTLKALQAEGLLQDPPLAGLTDAGRDQLAAFKRAVHGGERRKSQGRWPLDRFRRNPLNRTIDPEAVLGLADTIVGVGDILMPLVVSAPDADGIRTIWAGERRWMAATRLAQLDQLPEALLQGLPFTERAADKGEAAVITLIENGARSDLTPWDDARQLRIAADETGLNATELARRIGRARDGDRGGVRDVQVKIKVAREATPEAIAAYEADPSAPGAWEALRASVAAKAAQDAIVTTKAQRLALAELFHKADRTVGRDVAILPAGHMGEGARLAQYGLAILTRRDTGDTARVTSAGADYLQAERLDGSIEMARSVLGYPEGYGVARYRTEWLNTVVSAAAPAPSEAAETRALQGIEPITTGAADPLVVNGIRYPNLARANEAKRAAGLLPRSSNSGGGERRAPQNPSLKQTLEDLGHACDVPVESEQAQDDAADARAAETLAAVRAFVAENGLSQPFGGWALRKLISSLEFAGPFVASGSGGSDDPNEGGIVWDAADRALAVCDANGQLPDDAAEAQAELIAYALNFACSLGAQGVGARTLDWPTAPEDETTEAALIRTGRLLEKIVGGAQTVTGDEALAAETLRQFGRALRDLETRLASTAEAA